MGSISFQQGKVLVKKLLEGVKVSEDFLEFRFKSGVMISVEK